MTEVEAIKVLEKEKAYMDSHGGDTQSKALEMAIKALGKQIAKKPVGLKKNICPNCSWGIVMTTQKYCDECGQKLDR